ncbi:MAG: PEP-CTERM sorting domain-containing protein, partial [Burkholderiales bacterium]|nr:PEP-CTERM sorting domain-containing protein [Burkholderiales bacterium]
LHLAAGSDYSFEVMGKPGLYHVTWCLSPVPEPETLALALAGAAMVVGTARRRWSQSWRA